MRNDRITSLTAALAELHAGGALDDPALFAPPNTEHYARHLIWRDPDARFVVIGLTWLPGQFSPLHDHGGRWGAEIVVDGTMTESSFRSVDRDVTGRYRFERANTRVLEAGAIGTLTPPLEYHDFRNTGTSVARTLHVYSGDLDSCRMFTTDDGIWYAARTVELRYDV